MSTDRLKKLRERTTLVKAAALIEKRGGAEAVIAKLLKNTRSGRNGLAAAQTNKKQKDIEKKSDKFLKTSSVPPSAARPGAGITSMGTGMAPFQFRAQPQVAQNSLEIAGRGLQKAYPGLTPATKSTSAMKRNSGSVMASATRQTGKKAKGELVAPTAALTAAPVSPSSKTVLASREDVERHLEEMEKAAFVAPLVRGGVAAWKALRRGGGLTRAYRSAAAARTHGTRASRARDAARAADKAAAAAKRAKPPVRTPHTPGTGVNMFRNVYTQGGQQFAGPMNPINLIPGVGPRIQARMMNYARMGRQGADPKNVISLTRQGSNTGGQIARTAKGMGRGAMFGGGAGYGASYIPGVGDSDLKNASWYDGRRLRMAGMGAQIGTGFGGSAGAVVGSGLLNWRDPFGLNQGGANAMASLQEGANRMGRRSKIRSVVEARNKHAIDTRREQNARAADLDRTADPLP